MAIVFDDAHLGSYMARAVEAAPDHPVLIDRFLDDAFEFDVDALSDGKTTWIGGIQEHIEKAGIHSGDSFSVLPAWKVTPQKLQEMAAATRKLAEALSVKGLMNIQFAVQNDELYVLEVNPRASRTVPFVSKATAQPLAKIAARCMVGTTLKLMRAPARGAGLAALARRMSTPSGPCQTNGTCTDDAPGASDAGRRVQRGRPRARPGQRLSGAAGQRRARALPRGRERPRSPRWTFPWPALSRSRGMRRDPARVSGQ